MTLWSGTKKGSNLGFGDQKEILLSIVGVYSLAPITTHCHPFQYTVHFSVASAVSDRLDNAGDIFTHPVERFPHALQRSGAFGFSLVEKFLGSNFLSFKVFYKLLERILISDQKSLIYKSSVCSLATGMLAPSVSAPFQGHQL